VWHHAIYSGLLHSFCQIIIAFDWSAILHRQMTPRISVQYKSDWTKRFKSGVENRRRVTDDWWVLFVAAGSRDGAENQKARLEKSVLINGWSSSGMADEHKVWLQPLSVIQHRYVVHYLVIKAQACLRVSGSFPVHSTSLAGCPYWRRQCLKWATAVFKTRFAGWMFITVIK